MYQGALHELSTSYHPAVFLPSPIEVSPIPLSPDSMSRWLNNKHFLPRDLWHVVKSHIDLQAPALLVADDSILSKTRSKQIGIVKYEYSGNKHGVMAGIGLLKLLDSVVIR